jgi:phage shock protein A
MGLLGRLKNIVKGKANGAIEKAERNDPIAIAKVELVEAKEDLGKLESAVKMALGQRNIATTKVAEVTKSSEKWLAQAKIAKEAGNMDLAEQALAKCTEFEGEAKRRQDALDSSEGRYEQALARFKSKTTEIDALGSKIKEAEVNFKTAKALNDLETSETSGAGVKSVDRINDMLDMADEEVAMSEAGLEIGQDPTANLEADIAKIGNKQAVADRLANL